MAQQSRRSFLGLVSGAFVAATGTVFAAQQPAAAAVTEAQLLDVYTVVPTAQTVRSNGVIYALCDFLPPGGGATNYQLMTVEELADVMQRRQALAPVDASLSKAMDSRITAVKNAIESGVVTYDAASAPVNVQTAAAQKEKSLAVKAQMDAALQSNAPRYEFPPPPAGGPVRPSPVR